MRSLLLKPLSSPSANYNVAGKKAVYEYSEDFGATRQRLHSELDLFCGIAGNWIVAFRTTAPATVDYAPRLIGLMKALDWPSAPPAASPSVTAVIGVHRVGQSAQLVLAGLIVKGPAADVAHFQGRANALGIRAGTLKLDEGNVEAMASFIAPDFDSRKALLLYRETNFGTFGHLGVEVMLISPDDFKSGPNWLEKIVVEPADSIQLP